MIQRVGIAQALLNDPEVIFLDEPMSGLDPLGRRDVRALILELRDQGRTVFFSSHILSDAEALCRRVAVVARRAPRGRRPAVGHPRVSRSAAGSWSSSDVPPEVLDRVRPAVQRVAGDLAGPIYLRAADGRSRPIACCRSSSPAARSSSRSTRSTTRSRISSCSASPKRATARGRQEEGSRAGH